MLNLLFALLGECTANILVDDFVAIAHNAYYGVDKGFEDAVSEPSRHVSDGTTGHPQHLKYNALVPTQAIVVI
jgi:hypothetical protein